MSFVIHRLIFENNIEGLRHILCKNRNITKQQLEEQDSHGNTPLHLACILGCTESIKLLIERNASCRINNKYKCSPLHESISFGNRENLRLIFSNFVNESKSIFCRESVAKCLENLPDCKFTLNWKFKTWIPFMSNILPADICTIWKKNACIRVDSSIPDIEHYFKSIWKKKEEISIVINTSRDPYGPFFLDHTNGTYKNISDFADTTISRKELNTMLCTEIYAMRFDFKNPKIEPQLTGIWQKEQKYKTIDKYNCKCIQVSNIEAQMIMRNEHLNDNMKGRLSQIRSQFAENIKAKNENFSIKEKMKNFEESLEQLFDEQNSDNQLNRIIPNVTFDEYQEAEDCFKILGRNINIKIMHKPLNLEAAVTDNFYLQPAELISVLEYIVTLKQFEKLKKLAQLVSPHGFPMQIEVPVFPTIKATVTLSDFVFDANKINDDLFEIPEEYTEKTSTIN